MKSISKFFFITICFVVIQTYGMDKDKGSLSIIKLAQSVSNGATKTISGPLLSGLAVAGWYSITNNSRPGICDSNTYKNPQVIYPILGGIVGKTIKNTIDQQSYDQLPRPLQLVLSNPFLCVYTTLHIALNYKDITKNPLPYIGETALLATHLLAQYETKKN